MKITPIAHTDVTGKVMLYLKIENDKGSETYVNIGQKTFNNVANLLNEETKKQETQESAEEQAKRMEKEKNLLTTQLINHEPQNDTKGMATKKPKS